MQAMHTTHHTTQTERAAARRAAIIEAAQLKHRAIATLNRAAVDFETQSQAAYLDSHHARYFALADTRSAIARAALMVSDDPAAAAQHIAYAIEAARSTYANVAALILAKQDLTRAALIA
jgi:hypothetical protein